MTTNRRRKKCGWDNVIQVPGQETAVVDYSRKVGDSEALSIPSIINDPRCPSQGTQCSTQGFEEDDDKGEGDPGGSRRGNQVKLEEV